ncbi:MAG: alpha/beta hydrolase, partial [Desulfobulbaceae bacterium]|nr:alpha/beta hydrolase [Desulfobulbaceae bacterium]
MKQQVIIIIILVSLLTVAGCKSVVNKMAFHPDVDNIYPVDKLPVNVSEIFIKTKDGLTIQSYLILNNSSNKMVIYFHGNGGNIGHRLADLKRINSFGVNVLGVGYRGYGKSEGEPSEEGIYIDGESALAYVVQKLGFREENVYLFGRSIGTTVAINTGQKRKLSGMILVAPLTSGKEHAQATGLGLVSFLAGDSFDNISKVGEISCPVLVIHGTEDRVIPFEMGERIYQAINSPKQFIKISGVGHNDLSFHDRDDYWS